ncbi:MAG: hypothetical protein ACP5N2_04610 [Candidatus Nanoarchaeia archaeon]
MQNTLPEQYSDCQLKGHFRPMAEFNKDIILTFVSNAKNDLKTLKDIREHRDRSSTIFKLTYDVLHSLAEAICVFDKVKPSNHQCLFAYLCFKHPELNLEWYFFEEIRIKRNELNYEGKPITKSDLSKLDTQAKKNIDSLLSHINSKMNTL